MAKEGVKGSIVLTSSVLGFFGIPGYSAYAPIKHALRGLADCLRSELQLYGIRVHCYFPATMFSPGFELEQETKPELTKVIEGPDEGLSSDECAKRLLNGWFFFFFLSLSFSVSLLLSLYFLQMMCTDGEEMNLV